MLVSVAAQLLQKFLRTISGEIALVGHMVSTANVQELILLRRFVLLLLFQVNCSVAHYSGVWSGPKAENCS